MNELTVELTCPQCQHPFAATAHQILDFAVAPQMREDWLRGRINTVICPQCQAVGYMPMPLVVHDPMPQKVYVLIPDFLSLTPEEEEQVADDLVRDLISARGIAEEQIPTYFRTPILATSPEQMAGLLVQQDGVGRDGEDSGAADLQRREGLLLIRQVLTTPDIPAFVKQNLEKFDATFFALLTFMISKAQNENDGEFGDMLRQLGAYIAAEKRHLLSPETQRALSSLERLVQAETEAQQRQIVAEVPEFLSLEAIKMVQDMVDESRLQGADQLAQSMEQLRVRLKSWRAEQIGG